MSDESVAELVARCREGDSQAETLLFERHLQSLLALVRARISTRLAPRFDAEDVVQSAKETSEGGLHHVFGVKTWRQPGRNSRADQGQQALQMPLEEEGLCLRVPFTTTSDEFSDGFVRHCKRTMTSDECGKSKPHASLQRRRFGTNQVDGIREAASRGERIIRHDSECCPAHRKRLGFCPVYFARRLRIARITIPRKKPMCAPPRA